MSEVIEVQNTVQEVYGTFAGAINHDSCQKIMGHLDIAVTRNISKFHLLIQSSGGIAEDGVALYNYLRGLPLELVTYNVGGVQSAGVTVFLAGKQRVCSPTSFFMVHQATATLPVNINIKALQDAVSYLAITNENVLTILRTNTTLSEDKLIASANRDLYLAAEDAKSYGLVHEIADFTPPPGSPMFAIM